MVRSSLLFMLIFIGLSACSRQMYTVQSVGIIAEQNGIVTIRSTGYGQDKSKAIHSAEQNAVELLLFRGMPGSQQAIPMVSVDEAEVKARHNDYFKELLTNGRYRTFILSSVPVTNFIKHGQAKRNITVDVQINVPALRSDLETHNVIRKFGY